MNESIEQQYHPEIPDQNKQQPEQNNIYANPPEHETRIASAELSPEEQQEIKGVKEQVLSGLGVLYDTLPHQGDIKTDTINEAMDNIEILQSLGPAVKRAIGKTVEREELHQKEKDEFIDTVMKLSTLDMWIHMQGLNNAGDNRLAEIRQQIKSH